MNRRQFLALPLAAWGLSRVFAASPDGVEPSLLPTVRWGKHQITRVLVGHNPIKGMSHFSEQLNREMREWFAADSSRGLQLFRRCQEVGINACQIGFRPSERELIEDLLRNHYRQGGTLQWMASFYSLPTDRQAAKEELARMLEMRPRPIGIQQVGNTTDELLKQGRMDLCLENLKRFRDAGLLVGLGAHNHEAIDDAASKGWDVDFYQCCFYRSVFSPKPSRAGELFEEADRDAMVKTIRQVSKPCIAFKVLGANRFCGSPEAVERALRFAFEHIKSTDVVLLGMWHKHRDQVAENASMVRKILGVA